MSVNIETLMALASKTNSCDWIKSSEFTFRELVNMYLSANDKIQDELFNIISASTVDVPQQDIYHQGTYERSDLFGIHTVPYVIRWCKLDAANELVRDRWKVYHRYKMLMDKHFIPRNTIFTLFGFSDCFNPLTPVDVIKPLLLRSPHDKCRWPQYVKLLKHLNVELVLCRDGDYKNVQINEYKYVRDGYVIKGFIYKDSYFIFHTSKWVYCLLAVDNLCGPLLPPYMLLKNMLDWIKYRWAKNAISVHISPSDALDAIQREQELYKLSHKD